ncbi:MAG: SEC-C metal-binding domain-containing protein [Candidatus Pacearchaeota archaeon]|jgi:uncharacterized protein YchJ|nr:SEC-C domain-containing protein [Clostridia bacterium]
MPDFKTIMYRHWCTKCQDWEFFKIEKIVVIDSVPDENAKTKRWVCTECGTEHVDVMLKDIPKEKLAEQRQRYIKSKEEKMIKAYKSFFQSSQQSQMEQFIHMFSEPEIGIEIVEADAGQKYIDEENQRIRTEEREKRIAERNQRLADYAPYRKLGRNDKCLCGSDKKYKKCCQPKFQDLE